MTADRLFVLCLCDPSRCVVCFPARSGRAAHSEHNHTDPHVKRYETQQQGGSRRVHCDEVRVAGREPVDENRAEEAGGLQLCLHSRRKELRAEPGLQFVFIHVSGNLRFLLFYVAPACSSCRTSPPFTSSWSCVAVVLVLLIIYTFHRCFWRFPLTEPCEVFSLCMIPHDL